MHALNGPARWRIFKFWQTNLTMFGTLELLEYGLAFLTIFTLVFFLVVFVQNRGSMHRTPEPPKKLPSLTILIPAFNERETIAKTLDACIAADYHGGRKEIIVIDDGSADGTFDEAGRYEELGVRVLRQKNGGKAAALNHGLREADTELIATVDADSYPEKDALLKLVGYFVDKDVAAATSVMKVWEPRSALEKFQRLEYLLMVFSRRILAFIDAINVTPGPLSMFRKSAVDAVGGYDEKSILEDQELAMRLQAHHYRICASMDAVVHTVVPKTVGGLINQRVRWQRGGMRNILKHHYLVSPAYGDFGVLMMPLAIVSILVVFLVMAMTAYYTFTEGPASLFAHGLEGVYLGLRPIHILTLIVLVSSVAWVLIGMRQLKGESLSPFWLAGYLMLYAPVLTFFWLVTAFRELRREKLKW
jgi:cellulose synthase/poly-beta-1,6-N-acetylglucosamine synthase-like glycosyltransferase